MKIHSFFKKIFGIISGKNFIIGGFLLLSLFFGFYLFYNQKNAAAAETSLYCEPEIPIGEALEKTAEILQNTQNELLLVNEMVFNEIAAANKMIELALNCNVSKCNAVCQKTSFSCGTAKKPATCWSCPNQMCIGEPCDNAQIQSQFSQLESSFNQIKGSSNRIKNIFNGKTEAGEKLYEARQKFDDCALSIAEWEAAMRGEKNPKYSLSCVTVLRGEFPRDNEECKSLFNFFCCH